METMIDKKKEISMSAGEANVKALAFAVPIIVIFGIPYFIIWGKGIFSDFWNLFNSGTLFIIIYVLIGTVIHEFIHGLFWSFFLKNGFKSIKFGVVWKYLTPYCHCKKPMKMKHYRLGAIMPCIILGVIPAVISLFTGSIGMFVFGVFFSLAAGGDLLMIWLLRSENRNDLVQDHPDKIGCFILT